jgi:hypothetical protein
MPCARQTSSIASFRCAPFGRIPVDHDGTATIADGVTPYNNFRRLKFSVAQQRDLVQYLKSLAPRLVAKIYWMKVTSSGEPFAWRLKCHRRWSIRISTMVFSPACPLFG